MKLNSFPGAAKGGGDDAAPGVGYQQLAEAFPDAVVIADRSGLIRFINAAAEAANGIERAAWIDRPLRRFLHDAAFDGAQLLEAFESFTSVNQAAVASDGREFLFSTHPIRDVNGVAVLFVIVQRNLDKLGERARVGRRGDRFMALPARPEMNAAEGIILSRRTQEIVDFSVRAMRLGSRVLLTGESGVGKTEIVKAVHGRVLGAGRPLIHVNCGSIPETLFESEMFGYEAGAFTGALQRGKKGLIEAANGGTLFLDEIGEAPLASQAKLLKFLEDNSVQRIGATDARPVRIRVVTATNRDLFAMAAAGTFRKDLFFRISALSLEVPPLRESREIVPLLIDRFVADFSRRRKANLMVTEDCRRVLMAYGFPGNIRELQNIIEHLAIVCDEVAEVRHLPKWVCESVEPPVGTPAARAPCRNGAGRSLKQAVQQYEAVLIAEAIRTHGSKRKAAEALGVDIATVIRKSRAAAS